MQHNPVCAVIVTYFPDTETLRNVLRSIAPQADAVVVVDNTPHADTIDLAMLTTEPEFPACHIIALGENKGIAAAQNTGIAWAQSRNAEYVLLLDQDSVPESSMIRQLIETANKLLAEGILLAAVGPRYVDPRTGRSSTPLQIRGVSLRQIRCCETLPNEVVRSDTLISSGSLIRLEVWKKIGTFDESLFIDHVDNEWFLRARHHGYSVYLACGIVLAHRLGEKIVRYWLGSWRTLPAHSPTRNYYLLRNTMLLSRYPHVPLAWLLGTFSVVIPILTTTLLLLPQRKKRLLLILRAIYDGLCGHSGSLGD